MKLNKWEKMVQDVSATKYGGKMLEEYPAFNTKKLYAKGALLFSEFLQKPIDDLVEEYQANVKADRYKGAERWEEIFKDFDKFLQKRWKGSSIPTFHCGALALLNCNVPRSLKLSTKMPQAYPRKIPPTPIEELREIDSAVDERKRFFLRFLKDSGISISDAVRLNVGDLKIEGDWGYSALRREKEHVDYETFVGPDTIKILRIYLDVRRRRGELISNESPLFADHKGQRLNSNVVSEMFRRLSEKTGKKVSPHRLRKFFETYMALGIKHPIVLKYWMGHDVASTDIEGKYIIPPAPEQLKLYKESYHNIELTQTVNLAEIQKRQEILEKLQMKIMTGEDLDAEDKLNIQKYRIKLAAKTPKEYRQEREGAGAGIDDSLTEQFEQIAEDKLLEYLRNGWKIEHKLGNGDLIVKRS